MLGNIALSSTKITLESLGLTHDMYRTLLTWALDKEVSLKFIIDPSCVYSREESKDVPGDEFVEETEGISSGLFGHSKTKTTKKQRIVHKVTEYIWILKGQFSLQACSGGRKEEACLDLLRETAVQELVTSSRSVTTSPVGPLQYR